MTKPHIAILMGGISAERPVSLISGRFCAEALSEAGYPTTCIDVTEDMVLFLQKIKECSPDSILNMLHGPFGEDGCIQGILEFIDIPYSHSGVLASALAMDKQKTKDILTLHNIPCPNSQLLTHKTYLEQKNALNFTSPYIIKPNCEGSSFGVHLVAGRENFSPMENNELWQYGTGEVLIEEYIPGRELTVTVMGDKPLTVTEIIPDTSFYDYDAKYTEGGSKHILPADIPKDVYDAAMNNALRAHQLLGCQGITRSDFRYNDTTTGPQGLYFLEINTQPGMTPTSLVPEQAKYAGISFAQLVSWMAEDPLHRNATEQHLNHAATQEENTQSIA